MSGGKKKSGDEEKGGDNSQRGVRAGADGELTLFLRRVDRELGRWGLPKAQRRKRLRELSHPGDAATLSIQLYSSGPFGMIDVMARAVDGVSL